MWKPVETYSRCFDHQRGPALSQILSKKNKTGIRLLGGELKGKYVFVMRRAPSDTESWSADCNTVTNGQGKKKISRCEVSKECCQVSAL